MIFWAGRGDLKPQYEKTMLTEPDLSDYSDLFMHKASSVEPSINSTLPEIKLLRAMLFLAYVDATNLHQKNRVPRLEIVKSKYDSLYSDSNGKLYSPKDSARDWFTSKSSERFSFRWVCTHLGFSSTLANKIKRRAGV